MLKEMLKGNQKEDIYFAQKGLDTNFRRPYEKKIICQQCSSSFTVAPNGEWCTPAANTSYCGYSCNQSTCSANS